MENQLNTEASQIHHVVHRNGGEIPQQIVDFVDQQIRPAAGFSVEQEYPALYGEFPGGHSLVLRVGGDIASHVGYVVREFQHLDFRMRVGIMGSVATATDFRGRGLASVLIEQGLQRLRRKGCHIALLWAEQPEFYRKFGFYKAGREIDLRFSPDDMPEIKEAPFELDRKRHGFSIWRLYQKHNVKIDRSLEEQQKLFSIPRIRIFVTEKDNRVTSYIVINKGADFRDYIHEWGGSAIEVQRNIAWVQKFVYPNKRLTLIAPAHYDLAPIRAISNLEASGILGLIKVIDRNALMDVYWSYLRELGQNIEIDRERQVLKIEGKDVSYESDEDLIKCVFGQAEQTIAPPLPFFLWGFDSI